MNERIGDEEFKRLGAYSRYDEMDSFRVYSEAFRARLAEAAAVERAEKAEADLIQTVRAASKLMHVEVCDGCLMGEAGKHFHLSEDFCDYHAEELPCLECKVVSAAVAEARASRDAALARAARLAEAIEKAPHALLCGAWVTYPSGPGYCSCWKKSALSAQEKGKV